ncbi:MAG: flavodoxin domain-containing protein [Chloroflexota bacterium]
MKISENVFYTGKIDWELRRFHGEQLSTNLGSSYNSFLVKGSEKTAIIDTVWTPHAEEFIENLFKLVSPDAIDCVVILHSEPDHAGALPLLMSKLPEGTPIYCSANGAKAIKGQFHGDWNFKTVKTGDKLELGGATLKFVDAAMLHWPDTIMCLLEEQNMLFSSDVFGQHYASESLTDRDCDLPALEREALKYYANIVAPFAKKAKAKLEELEKSGINPAMILPAHGVIWTKQISKIIDLYKAWSSGDPAHQATIVYDTMYNSTRRIADSIGKALAAADPKLEVKIFNASKSDASEIVTEIFRSKYLLVGSPTYNNGILNSIAAVLEEIKGMNLEGRIGYAFGSYGWAPRSVTIISEALKEAGYDMPLSPFKFQWAPDAAKLNEAAQIAPMLLNPVEKGEGFGIVIEK